jgi:hypothetical protein
MIIGVAFDNLMIPSKSKLRRASNVLLVNAISSLEADEVKICSGSKHTLGPSSRCSYLLLPSNLSDSYNLTTYLGWVELPIDSHCHW